MADALQSKEDIKADAMKALEDSSPSNNGEPAAPPAEPAGQEPKAPEAAAPPAPNPEDAAKGAEPKEGDKDWKVPGERLQEQVKKREAAEAELATERKKREDLEATIAAGNKNEPEDDPDGDDDDVELKPEVLKAMKKQGFLTKAEAEKLAEDKATGILAADKKAVEARQQAVADKQDLTKEFSDKGYPAFEIDKVLPTAVEMVGENHVNKQALRAAYLEVHASEIEDVLIKKANAASKTPDATAEKPGGSPALKGDPEPANVKEKTKAAIAAAIPD